MIADSRCTFSSVGPVSSLHDRACELFYSLMGGTGEFSDCGITWFVLKHGQWTMARRMRKSTGMVGLVVRTRWVYTPSGPSTILSTVSGIPW